MNPPASPPAAPPRGVSAQLDRFVHDRLPPPGQWPDLHYNRPELQFPPQLNLVEELLDKAPAKGFGQRPLLRSSRVTFSYEEVAERVNRIAQWLTEDMGLVSGNRVLRTRRHHRQGTTRAGALRCHAAGGTEIRPAGAPGPAHHPEIQCRGRSGRPGRPVRRQVRGVCALPDGRR